MQSIQRFIFSKIDFTANDLHKDHPLAWKLSFDEKLLESIAKERVHFHILSQTFAIGKSKI